jgi:hypothetical protein
MRPGFFALTLTALAASGANAQVTVAVDAAANRHPISPLIYGVHFADTPTLLDLNATINRYGGNSAGRYNWNLNVDNRGADYFFESIPYGSAVHGELGDTFISTTKAGGGEPFLTMPMVGWVAKTDIARNTLCSFSVALYGPQTGANGDCGNGISQATLMKITTNNPNDASGPADHVFQQGWVNHVVTVWNPAASGGLRYWGFDNEPSLWHTVYWDVHNTPSTMDEMSTKMANYGSMIKGADSGVQTLGPEEWGWDGYFYSGKDQQAISLGQCSFGGANCPDYLAHGSQDYVPYLLTQMKQYETVNHQRILDWLSLHFYPQGGEYAFANACYDAAGQPLRNRSTRGLWDPSYVNESYIGTQFPPGDPRNIVRLIPRMKEWVSTYYPGLKVGLTEYNWGAECEIGGATAQADLLGIFGRENLDMAIRWAVPGVTYPCNCPNLTSYKAFKMYRNYDGLKSTFGDTSVSATVPDPDTLAAFAAQRSSDGFLTIMAINKVAASTPTTIQLASFNGTTSEAWQLTSANVIGHLADIPVAGPSFSTTLPGQSITLFVVHGTSPAAQFYTVTPCRVADTRNAPGPSGGPALGAGASRTFPVAGLCGIPPGAKAIAINVTVVNETQLGDLRLYPAGGSLPATSSINFAMGKVRANNQIIALGAGGQISVQCDLASAGTTDFLFDVTGYFQ